MEQRSQDARRPWNAPRVAQFVDPEAQQLATEEEISRRRAMAEALRRRSGEVEMIQHPLQGVAKMADAGIAGLLNAKAEGDDRARRQAYGRAILGMIPEGAAPGVDREALARAMAIDPSIGEAIVSQQIKQSMQPPPDPVNVASGGTLVDPRTGKVIYQGAPEPQKPMNVAPGNRVVDPATGKEIYAAPAEVPQPLPEDVLNQKIELAQAGRSQSNTTINNKGSDEVAKLVAKAWNDTEEAALDAQKRAPLYDGMEAAMEGFNPGATAEVRAKAAGIMREFGIGEGMPEAEVYRGLQRKLELAATPKGQGQITENERVLIRDTIPGMTMTPEAIKTTIGMLRALDAYDYKVAQIFRDSAKANGGLPDPVTVREQVSALGPALHGDAINRLQAVREQQKAAEQPAGGGEAATAAPPPSGNYRFNPETGQLEPM